MKPRIHKSSKGGAPAAKARREAVIKRLEAQLEAGTKPSKEDFEGQKGVKEAVPLTDSDRNRIEKELTTLKSRV